MPHTPTRTPKKIFGFRRSRFIASTIGGVFLLLIIFLIAKPKHQNYQYVAVTKGSITETVSVTGNTTPISSVSLGFGNSGTITQVNSAVGNKVGKGQVLARLDSSDLYAQLKQAQANLAVQRAQGQNTTVNVAEVQKQQDILVANARHALLSASLQAVPDDLSVTVPAPTITGSYTGEEGEYVIHMYPSNSSSGESFYVTGLENTSGSQASTNPVALGTHGLYIQFASASLTGYGNTVWTVSIPNTKSPSYTANENAYLAAQANRDKAIADAQAAINSNASGASVSQAQIASAEAAVQSIQAKLQNSEIIAPISGTITQFDAKVGQFASPATPLVSIISQNSFEVDALVSEIDVGKIALDNTVSMTLDAFSGETFTGTVFYIDPAQTTTNGVVGYKVKIAFDKEDARMKSGLTANLVIKTRSKDNVLIVPQYAILQNDNGTFVEVLDGKKVKDMPVTLGLQDEDGNVEVTSGVTEGEQVLNIGLK
jgi:HlyD family secretion protein